eukprot:jgi/Tetstr1/464040/TSEL_008845.t1
MALDARDTRKLARAMAGPDDEDFEYLPHAVAFLGGRGACLRKEDYRALCERLGVGAEGTVRDMARRLRLVGRECRNDPAKAAQHRRNFRDATVVFMDMGASFVDAVREELSGRSELYYHVEYVTGMVDRLPRENTAFVSPANSLGIMRGGIDAAYAAMFPGVEAAVQGGMREYKRYPYPVGECFPVLVDESANTWLLSCPTMPRPGMDVRTTRNAQLAVEAALGVFDELAARKGVRRLVCPGLCTGVGGMSARECASQIGAAMK